MKIKTKVAIMLSAGLVSRYLYMKNIDKGICWYYKILCNK